MTDENECPHVYMTGETADAMMKAQRERDPRAVAAAAEGVKQCTLGVHEGHDHENGDLKWSSLDDVADDLYGHSPQIVYCYFEGCVLPPAGRYFIRGITGAEAAACSVHAPVPAERPLTLREVLGG